MKFALIIMFFLFLICSKQKDKFMDFEFSKTFNWDFMDNNVPRKLHSQSLIHPLDEISMWIETHNNKQIKDANNLSVDKNLEILNVYDGEKQLGKWKYKIGHFLSEDDRLRSMKGLLRTRDKLYNIWTLQTDDYKKVNTVITNYSYQVLGILRKEYQDMQFEQIKRIAKIHANTYIVYKIDLLMGLQKDKPLNWRYIVNRYNPHLCLSKPSIYNPSRKDNYAEEHVCGELVPDQQLWSVEGDRIISKENPSLCLTRDICHNTLKKCTRENSNQVWSFKPDGSFYHKMDEHECDDEDRYVFEKARY